jgi:general secretion pathway protein E
MMQNEASLDRLAERLVSARGHCDLRAMERARRVSLESGQRIDAVLLQLGLMTERGLAVAYAELLG